MKQKGRDFRPNLKPVTRIELTETNTKLRWALIVVLLAVAVVAIGTGLMSLLNTQPGWQTVEVTASGPNCGGDFKFLYDFSDCGREKQGADRPLLRGRSECLPALFSGSAGGGTSKRGLPQRPRQRGGDRGPGVVSGAGAAGGL